MAFIFFLVSNRLPYTRLFLKLPNQLSVGAHCSSRITAFSWVWNRRQYILLGGVIYVATFSEIVNAGKSSMVLCGMLPKASDYMNHKIKFKAELLSRMDKLVPWPESCAVIKPHYPKAGNRRRPIGLERMLWRYFSANRFNLADEACEGALHDISAFRNFCRVDLGCERVNAAIHDFFTRSQNANL